MKTITPSATAKLASARLGERVVSSALSMQVPDFATFDLERELAPPTWPGPDPRPGRYLLSGPLACALTPVASSNVADDAIPGSTIARFERVVLPTVSTAMTAPASRIAAPSWSARW